MKRIAYLIAAVAVLGLGACEKQEQLADISNLGIGSYLTLVKANNTRINFSDLNNSTVSITVAEKGQPVDKITIYVTEGVSKVRDVTKWKKVKEVPYSGETTLSVKATEIAAALGIPPSGLKPGETYMLYNQITTKDGQVFDLSTTGGDFEGITNYNMALTWQAIVVCPFVPTGFPGTFTVVSDGWGDYVPGEKVTVNSATANSISLTAYPSEYYGAVDRRPITVTIDPATGAATVAAQIYGDYPQFGLLDMTVTSSGTNNWVFACSGTINLLLTHSQGQGTYRLILKKD